MDKNQLLIALNFFIITANISCNEDKRFPKILLTAPVAPPVTLAVTLPETMIFRSSFGGSTDITMRSSGQHYNIRGN